MSESQKAAAAVAAADPSAELTELFPQPVEVLVGGKMVSIEAFSIEQTGKVARALKPVVAALTASDTTRPQEILMFDLLADHTDALCVAAAYATNEPEEWVRKLKFDQFLLLMFSIGEVNLDFFVRRVGPAVSARLGALTGKLGAGLTH